MADFLAQGPSKSTLLAALMEKQNRRYANEPDPLSTGEAFARGATQLVDAFSQKGQINDELERRNTMRENDMATFANFNDERATGTLGPATSQYETQTDDPNVRGYAEDPYLADQEQRPPEMSYTYETDLEVAVENFNAPDISDETRQYWLGEIDTIKAAEKAAELLSADNAREDKRRIGEAEVAAAGDKRTITKELESASRAISKDYGTVEGAIARIREVAFNSDGTINATPAAALSLVFNYMKMLDPASVVRESEFKTAAEARAWMSQEFNADGSSRIIPSAVASFIDQFEGKGFLIKEQIIDFTDRADELFVAANKTNYNQLSAIRAQATDNEIPFDQVFTTGQIKGYEQQQFRDSFNFDDPENPDLKLSNKEWRELFGRNLSDSEIKRLREGVK